MENPVILHVNYVEQGQSIPEMCEKAVYNKSIQCGLGDGVINNREFLHILKSKEYQGPFCIEAPRQGDREWFAKQDIAYIRTLLESI